MKGWISLHRKILDNPILSNNRTYSRMEAFIYLLLTANHCERNIPIGSTLYEVKKGQMITSQKKLCKQFNWGNTKLRNYLKLLENDAMIKVETEVNLTRITILKYESYQDSQLNDKPKQNQKQTKTKLQTNTNNNVNNSNNENNVYKRMDKFTLEVHAEGIKHIPMVAPNICDDFIDYWTELNRSKTKMKFELQQTFEISRRLKKWVKNDSNFYNKANSLKPVKKKKQFKLSTTGKHYVAYCECGKSDFYPIWEADKGMLDTKCCGKELLTERIQK